MYDIVMPYVTEGKIDDCQRQEDGRDWEKWVNRVKVQTSSYKVNKS